MCGSGHRKLPAPCLIFVLYITEISETLGLGLDHFPGLGLGLKNTHYPGLGLVLGLSLEYS